MASKNNMGYCIPCIAFTKVTLPKDTATTIIKGASPEKIRVNKYKNPFLAPPFFSDPKDNLSRTSGLLNKNKAAITGEN